MATITKAANPGWLMTLNGKKAKGMATKAKKKTNGKASGKAANHAKKPVRHHRNPDLKSLPIAGLCVLGGVLATRFIGRFIPIQRTQIIDIAVDAGIGAGLGFALSHFKVLSDQNAFYVAAGGVSSAASKALSYYFPTLQEMILNGSAVVVPSQPVQPTAGAPAGGVADVVYRLRDRKPIGMGNIEPYPAGIQHGGVYGGGMNNIESYPHAA